MSNSDQSNINIESLKICIESEKRKEKSFVRYLYVSLLLILFVSLAKSQQTVKIPILGVIKSELFVNNFIYIIIFMISIMIYGFLEWSLAIIDLNRHLLFNQISTKTSITVIIANWWDDRVKCKYLKATSIIDLIANLMFFVIFITFSLFILKIGFHVK